MTELRVTEVNILQVRACNALQFGSFGKVVNAVYFYSSAEILVSVVSEDNLFTIKLDKSAGKCSCQRLPLAVNLTG